MTCSEDLRVLSSSVCGSQAVEAQGLLHSVQQQLQEQMQSLHVLQTTREEEQSLLKQQVCSFAEGFSSASVFMEILAIVLLL